MGGGSVTRRMSLSRVGITGVEKVLHIAIDGRTPQPFPARLACFVEPGAGSPGARFEEVMNDAIHELVRDVGMRPEWLAQRLANHIRDRLGARRAEASISVRLAERRPAPVSGRPTQEISTVYGRAVATERGTRRVVGISAQGMTTSPYAQDLLAARARERLAAGGFPAARIARIVDAVPVATDSQTSVGTLHLGCREDRALEFDFAVLLGIVEGTMASEIFELLKRSDERAVVERAHRRPRYVEDCVRATIAGAVERLAGVPDDVLVAAAQETVETMHGHNVVAERAGLLGELRRELAGAAAARPTSLREWLDEDRP
jgi:GTP cyclohydrolase IV